MTLDELNDTIDAMALAAAGDPHQLPGLITINTELWVKDLADMRAPCKALHDGMRHRDIVVHIFSTAKTEVLTRTEAGERGAPYRDLMPRP
jgi:hypothetical protein